MKFYEIYVGINLWNIRKTCEFIFILQELVEMHNSSSYVWWLLWYLSLCRRLVLALFAAKKLAMTSPKAGSHFFGRMNPHKSHWSSAFLGSLDEVFVTFCWRFFLLILFMRFMLISLSFPDISGRFPLKRKHQILQRWIAASTCVTCCTFWRPHTYNTHICHNVSALWMPEGQ